MTMQTLARDDAGPSIGRAARTYLMCPPTHFAVSYSINPWMDPSVPVDSDRALEQWTRLRTTYLSLGHTVHLLDPVPDLPDMVFAANGATVVAGTVLGSRFRNRERGGEADAHHAWFAGHGYRRFTRPEHINEGEGDFTYTHRAIVAGYGFRTDLAAHAEPAATFGLPVVSVRLVDPRFYHLDTALCVIDPMTAAYYPGAFDDEGVARLRALFPDLIEATEADAGALGLNAVSDGRHVVLPREAVRLGEQLAGRGFVVLPVEVSELRKAGGGPKCCTLELRP